MKTRILIAGANGYVGKHLTAQLNKLDSVDLVLSDVQDKSFFEGVKYFKWDISSKNDIAIEQIKQCQYVFFFGGLTGTINSIDRYNDFVNVNELGLLNLLNILRFHNPACKVIFPSTRLVYKGKKDTFLKEDDEKEFKTIYAINKFSCENYLRVYEQCYGIKYTVFRICVPYGNMLDDKLSYGTISQFLNKASEGNNLTVFGDGLQRRTFTHISDLANVIVGGSFNSDTDNRIFNVGGNDHLSIRDVAEQIAKLFSVSVEFKLWGEMDSKIESGDTIFDSKKIDSLLNYRYQYDFDGWVRSFLKKSTGNAAF